MDRPISPTSIIEMDVSEEMSNTIDISSEHIRNAAIQGFHYIKQKLNKETLNSGEMLLEFWNYNETNGERFTELFCLAILVLMKSKDTLNEISDNVYTKLINHSTNLYNSKIDLF